jgi:hypothetical protein
VYSPRHADPVVRVQLSFELIVHQDRRLPFRQYDGPRANLLCFGFGFLVFHVPRKSVESGCVCVCKEGGRELARDEGAVSTRRGWCCVSRAYDGDGTLSRESSSGERGLDGKILSGGGGPTACMFLFFLAKNTWTPSRARTHLFLDVLLLLLHGACPVCHRSRTRTAARARPLHLATRVCE